MNDIEFSTLLINGLTLPIYRWFPNDPSNVNVDQIALEMKEAKVRVSFSLLCRIKLYGVILLVVFQCLSDLVR